MAEFSNLRYFAERFVREVSITKRTKNLRELHHLFFFFLLEQIRDLLIGFIDVGFNCRVAVCVIIAHGLCWCSMSQALYTTIQNDSLVSEMTYEAKC